MKFYFFLFCIFISTAASSQLEEGVLPGPVDLNKFMPSQLKDFYADISIDNSLPAGYKLPFSSIKIIDCRQDTFKLGFIPASPTREGPNSYECILVEKGLTYALSKTLNEHYHQNFSGDTMGLVIVVRRFWADPFPSAKLKTKETDLSVVFNMYMRFEYFFEKDDWYYPLKRLDTVFQITKGNSVAGCDDNRFKNCKFYGYAIAKAFEEVDYNYYASRLGRVKNKVTKQGLDSINNSCNNYPIVRDSLFQKGVYLSFYEFRNNKPSIKNYKIETVKKGQNEMSILYNLDSGKQEPITKYWGYCDGENIFCKFTPYPLAKFGNTFEFFIDKEEYHKSRLNVPLPRSAVGGLNFTFSTFSDWYLYAPGRPKAYTYIYKAEPMQFDMETGKAY